MTPPPPSPNTPRDPDNLDLIRRRQKSRALVMGLLLGALVILVFAITISKIQLGMH